MSVANSKQVSF